MAPREDLPPGLYELLVTHDLRTRLEPITGSASAHERALDVAEAPDRIALHVAGEVERALASVPESRRLRVAVETARAVIDRLEALAPSGVDSRPVGEGRVLRAILRRLPDGTPEHLDAPLIPVLDTTLLTNAPGEPSLLRQLQSEIDTADAIDVVMAFIRRSGVAPLLEPLRRHCARGRPFRVLTTTYTGSTEAAALDRLVEAGAEVRVSYDSSTTRLHAKSWIFHRPTGFSTAYVGSSNLTHSAQAAGVEWNVRLSGARNRIVLDKVSAVFEGYWESGEFTAYDPGEFAEHVANTRRNGPNMLSPVEVRPYPFQSRLLERLTLARLRGHHRNLLVAATGTGKTVMAALDYAALRRAHPRLLFVAHRREILDQSQATFRHVLRDPSFGERWDGGHRPSRFEHVFASIQTLANADLTGLDPSHFDVVIVDEFHHAAAASYDALLSHVRPGELLGLTATPERSDGIDVLHHFEGRIAAELRLWDAIDQQHLSPFLYRGIADGTDLRLIPWRSGRGYDVDGLERLYTSDDAWARLVVKNVLEHAAPDTMRCLGFCVSVDHARFMARHFVAHGISAVAVSADSRPDERRAALSDLASGAIRVVFSVDLFNEGVDLPEVDTLLLLRPTDSPVLFIQQLGRGLRRSDRKGHCTVLDFVGNHRREFRFDRRLRALLGGTRSEVTRAVEDGFPFLPSGCHMALDPIASSIVLDSLRNAIPSRWPAMVGELQEMRAAAPDVTLRRFLSETGLDLEDIYANGRSWTDLRRAAGFTVEEEPHQTHLLRALGRMLHVDDGKRLDGYRDFLRRSGAPEVADLEEHDRRLLRMLVNALAKGRLSGVIDLQQAVDLLWRHTQVLDELGQLLGLLDERVDHVHTPLATHPESPLQVHARYTRDEILAGMGDGGEPQVPTWREGVRDSKEARTDLLAFTLDKSTGRFSPTTRYRDYAISRTLIHWESQSTTRADSPTGRRYRWHESDGRHIFLFARLRADDRAFWFLGPARYRGHHGERPMAITWQLDHPLPADLYTQFAAAAA